MQGINIEEIFSSIPGHIFAKDLDGVYIFSNNQLEKDVVGKKDTDFPWKEQAEQLRQNDQKVVETKQSLSFVEKVFLGENELAYFYCVKSPLMDKDGNVVGIIGNALNITSLVAEA